MVNKIIILFCLNLFDAVCTAYLVGSGLAYEANPFMAYLINLDPSMVLFLSVKIFAGVLIAVTLFKLQEVAAATVAAYLLIYVYAAVACWHIYGMTRLGVIL